jgi:glycosyltransferase involved in cell wall biosynthesis
MKIAYLFGSLNRGGTETLLLDIFRNAKNNHLDVLCLYRKNGVFEKEFIESGVKIKRLSVNKNLIVYLIRLRRILLKNNIKIIHAQQPIDALLAKISCIGTGIKVILTFHGYDFNEKGMSLRILKFIIKRTALNLYVSNTQRQYYLGKYYLNPYKQKVVYNGISFDKFDKLSVKKNSLRNELKLTHATYLFGSVGNFNEVRDQFTICRFLKLLNENGIDFHFVFVGKRIEETASLFDRCVTFCNENGLKDKVTFLGVRDDVADILHQLDAFIYATIHDTFGIAIVEAMAVGLPVFVNDWEVMQEITDSGKYATLYKTKDECDLLQQFMLFLQDKVFYTQKAKQAADFVRQKYSIENHIAHLKEIYSSL